MKLAPFPTPNVLIRQWQDGEIEREELHELMAHHQRALLEEAEESRRNPIASYVEGVMNKRAAKRLIRDHGEAAIRELLVAMAEMDDFSPAAYLWNADHWDVALHCFVRHKSAPVIRIKETMIKSQRAVILIEHGGGKKKDTLRERVSFQRDWKGAMKVVKREQK